MGYRSDVRIITTKEGFDELKKFTDEYLVDRDYHFGNIMDRLDVDKVIKSEDDGSVYERYFGWNDIKWYDGIDGYDNIDAIIQGLNHLEDNNMSYRFVRIGESYDDYEEHYFNGTDMFLDYPEVVRVFADDIY